MAGIAADNSWAGELNTACRGRQRQHQEPLCEWTLNKTANGQAGERTTREDSEQQPGWLHEALQKKELAVHPASRMCVSGVSSEQRLDYLSDVLGESLRHIHSRDKGCWFDPTPLHTTSERVFAKDVACERTDVHSWRLGFICVNGSERAKAPLKY